MFSFFLVSLSFSWSELMYASAFEFALRSFPSRYRSRLDSVFSFSGDSFSRTTDAAAWLKTVRNPPFNIKSFDHWHFLQDPLNSPTTLHHDEDDLISNIEDFQRSLFGGVMTKPWAWSFGFKAYIGLVCDVHSLFHLTEFVSSEFPNGDDNGRKFAVVYDRTISLFDLWEDGCGYFGGGIEAVNESVDHLLADFPNSPYPSGITWSAADWNATKMRTIDLTKTKGYGDLGVGERVSAAYIAECQEVSRQQVAYAGYALASILQRISVPVYDPELFAKSPGGVRSADVAGWTIFLLLLPLTVLAAYRMLRPE
jgi:hypothetical protein